jgi:V/A-type H+-transporting ATPase subunit C
VALLLDEIELNRDAIRYGFAVGKARVLETRALDAAAYERLLDASGFAEQKRLLSESVYGRYLEAAETAEDVEEGLDDALGDFYRFLDKAALPEPVVRYFRLPYDFANLKAVAKARLLGASEGGLLFRHGSVDTDLFAGELVDLPGPLGKTAALLSGEEADVRDRREGVDTAAVDRLVDRAMFAELALIAKQSKSRFLVNLARLGIDLANVRTLARARARGVSARAVGDQLIEGGSVAVSALVPLVELSAEDLATALGRIPGLHALAHASLGEMATLDATLESVTWAALRRARVGNVGAEPVISYVLERESEVASLRVLLVGTLRGLDRETLRRHVMANGWA